MASGLLGRHAGAGIGPDADRVPPVGLMKIYSHAAGSRPGAGRVAGRRLEQRMLDIDADNPSLTERLR
jgi:hypothetical protein